MKRVLRQQLTGAGCGWWGGGEEVEPASGVEELDLSDNGIDAHGATCISR